MYMSFSLFLEATLAHSILLRENFKGCIRNVKFNKGYNGLEIVDWVNMENLHNILLNECPSNNR